MNTSSSQSFGSQGFWQQQQHSGGGNPSASHAPPPQSHEEAPRRRELEVIDALLYLEQVRLRFGRDSATHAQFDDIMMDFKTQVADTPDVIRRITSLFKEHSDLIYGFNTFLPPEYDNGPAAPLR